MASHWRRCTQFFLGAGVKVDAGGPSIKTKAGNR